MTEAGAAITDLERRDEIVVAARSCFQRWGISRTRMDDIAELVGIARPNLYRYFPNKQALIQTVMSDESRRINEARRARIPITGPVGPIISRSMIDGMRMALADDYLMALMAHENVGRAASAMVDPDHDSVRMDYWKPILDHGRRRSELRPGLTDHQIVRWFGALQLTFLENRELYPDLDAIAEQVELFVLPSVLA